MIGLRFVGFGQNIGVKKVAHDLPPRLVTHRSPTANGFPNVFSIGIEFFR